MSPPKTPDVAAVLARHGVPPDADAPTLLAELAARGWEAAVDDQLADGVPRGPRPRRFVALAFRRRPNAAVAGAPPVSGSHDHLHATGPKAEAALARVLARVLAGEG